MYMTRIRLANRPLIAGLLGPDFALALRTDPDLTRIQPGSGRAAIRTWPVLDQRSAALPLPWASIEHSPETGAGRNRARPGIRYPTPGTRTSASTASP